MVPLDVSTDRRLKTSRGHIGQLKLAILEASVSVDTMADIWRSIDVKRPGVSTPIEKRFAW
jgi:hypothetical protein